MKLAALFEYTFPKIKTKSVSKLPRGYHHGADAAYRDDSGNPPASPLKRGGAEHVGTGHFSSAYTSAKRSPEDVRKISRPQDANEVDGFYYYMIELAKHSDNGNPYFPRFRDITVYKQPDDTIVYSAKMETLIRVETALDQTPGSKEALYRRIFGDNLAMLQKRDDAESDPILAYDPEDIVVEVVKGYNLKEHVVDKDLINAALFIRKVADKHNIDIDIHDENVMMRRTPYGLQLVITDPLSFSH